MGGGPHGPGLSRSGLSRAPAGRPFIVLAGPTASGKSALALAAAREFGGVVVNADSMQVYAELAVLSARPGGAALAAAPHRLYGVLPAAERCSAGRWRELALCAIAAEPGLLPIVTGGTGLYLRALMEGLAPIPEVPPEIQAEGAARLAARGSAGLHAELDRVMASRLEPGDSQRVLRAWCVAQATGRSLADWQAEPAPGPARGGLLGPCLAIALLPPRAALYAACDARFEAMIAAGAVDEIRGLLALGLDPSLPAMKAVGVRQLGEVLAGRLALPAAIAAAQQETRRYAKRQITWIRHQLPQARIVAAQFSERILPEIFRNIRHFLLTATA